MWKQEQWLVRLAGSLVWNQQLHLWENKYFSIFFLHSIFLKSTSDQIPAFMSGLVSLSCFGIFWNYFLIIIKTNHFILSDKQKLKWPIKLIMYVAINSGVIFYPEMIKSPGLFFFGGFVYIFYLETTRDNFSYLQMHALDESTVTYIKKSFNISSDGKILIVHLLL